MQEEVTVLFLVFKFGLGLNRTEMTVLKFHINEKFQKHLSFRKLQLSQNISSSP